MSKSIRDIRARCGNTEIILDDDRLSVSVNGEQHDSIVLLASQLQQIRARLATMSIPLTLGDGKVGVGGISSEIELTRGMTRVSLSWWMSPPPEWNDVATIFDLLAEHLPREIVGRYDFAQGGE